jgi:hypothetical protein
LVGLKGNKLFLSQKTSFMLVLPHRSLAMKSHTRVMMQL